MEAVTGDSAVDTQEVAADFMEEGFRAAMHTPEDLLAAAGAMAAATLAATTGTAGVTEGATTGMAGVMVVAITDTAGAIMEAVGMGAAGVSV